MLGVPLLLRLNSLIEQPVNTRVKLVDPSRGLLKVKTDRTPTDPLSLSGEGMNHLLGLAVEIVFIVSRSSLADECFRV